MLFIKMVELNYLESANGRKGLTMITRLEKKKAINEFKKILNEYEEKGIYFICEIDDVYDENETHILHDYQIIDVYRDDD